MNLSLLLPESADSTPSFKTKKLKGVQNKIQGQHLRQQNKTKNIKNYILQNQLKGKGTKTTSKHHHTQLTVASPQRLSRIVAQHPISPIIKRSVPTAMMITAGMSV